MKIKSEKGIVRDLRRELARMGYSEKSIQEILDWFKF
jgi:hypothetical protein